MKIRSVTVNNKKARLELTVYSGETFSMPFAKLACRPTAHDRISTAIVDRELAREAVTYTLESGEEGFVHIDQVLEYNQDPSYLAELLIHKLTVEARNRMEKSGLSRREIAQRMRTSLPQIYRLLDPTNTRKSVGQLISLLHLLDCDVDLVVRNRRAA